MEENDSIVTDEQAGQETESDPKGRNAVIQSILERNFGPQEEAVDELVIEEPAQKEEAQEEYTLNVLGKEEKAPKEKVIEAGIRALQKESAADERLREASRKEQEINTRFEELKRLEETLLTKQDTGTGEIGLEFTEALLTDDDKIAKIVTKFDRDIENLKKEVSTVKTREEEKEKATLNNIVKHFHTGYQDIATDEVMTFAFNKFRKDVLATEPDPFKATEIAAEMTYRKFGIGEQSAKPSTTDIKANLSPQPKRASARVKAPGPPKTKSHAETLDDIRRGRSMK